MVATSSSSRHRAFAMPPITEMSTELGHECDVDNALKSTEYRRFSREVFVFVERILDDCVQKSRDHIDCHANDGDDMPNAALNAASLRKINDIYGSPGGRPGPKSTVSNGSSGSMGSSLASDAFASFELSIRAERKLELFVSFLETNSDKIFKHETAAELTIKKMCLDPLEAVDGAGIRCRMSKYLKMCINDEMYKLRPPVTEKMSKTNKDLVERGLRVMMDGVTGQDVPNFIGLTINELKAAFVHAWCECACRLMAHGHLDALHNAMIERFVA